MEHEYSKQAMNTEITVLIADDHPIFRKGLREIITAEPSLKLVAEVEDGARALEAIRSKLPQVAARGRTCSRTSDGILRGRAVSENCDGLRIRGLTWLR